MERVITLLVDFSKLSDSLETINKSKPLEIMVHGKWQLYSHYELTFDTITIWFLDNKTGGSIPIQISQIDRWRTDNPSDELKDAIAVLRQQKKELI